MLLEKLIEASSVSGQEKEVREIIKEEIENYVDSLEIDSLGNLIAFKKGKREGKTILISVPMDEIGGVVNKINSDGTLRFAKVGAYDERILISKIVKIGEDKITGVIGAKPIHLQKSDERKKALQMNQIYVDIGAKDKSDAEKYVNIGDYISIWSETKKFGNSIKGKALESRVPCEILIDLIKTYEDYSIYCAFTTMDKVRIFGARVIASKINPEYTIILDGINVENTTAELEKGPVINIKEMRAIFDKLLIKKVLDVSKENKINIQLATDEKNITGADFYQITGTNNKVLKISIPCKYKLTPVNIMSFKDIDNTKILLKELISNLGGR